MDPEQLRRSAWHEAGHALVSAVLVGRVTELSLIETEKEFGHTRVESGFADPVVLKQLHASTVPLGRLIFEQRASNMVSYLIAGQAAESILSGRHRLWLSRDIEDMYPFLELLYPEQVWPPANSAPLLLVVLPEYRRVRRWLKEHGVHLETVAETLRKRRTLDESAFQAILRRLPPMRAPRWGKVSAKKAREAQALSPTPEFVHGLGHQSVTPSKGRR